MTLILFWVGMIGVYSLAVGFLPGTLCLLIFNLPVLILDAVGVKLSSMYPDSYPVVAACLSGFSWFITIYAAGKLYSIIR